MARKMTCKSNKGMRVEVKFKKGHPFKKVTLRNVTEIHYRFKGLGGESQKIAFESDIHQQGILYDVKRIDEFETRLECKKVQRF